jgi:hypothetical protein
VGYKISANWTPIQGFHDFFYVYVWDMQHAADPFSEAIDIGEKGKPRRGMLRIDGADRTYKFDKIDLISAQVGVTRRNRYRLMEFRYTLDVINDGSTPVELNNNSREVLNLGALNEDYQYSLDEGTENLLGFRARCGASGGSLFRFTALRNNQNSFLKKMVAANDAQILSQRMIDFTVNFSKGNLKVTEENLDTWYVDESWGYLQEESQPPLMDLVSGDEARRTRNAISMAMGDYTQRELLKMDISHDPDPRDLLSQTIETSTFLFKPGYYQNPKIT